MIYSSSDNINKLFILFSVLVINSETQSYFKYKYH